MGFIIAGITLVSQFEGRGLIAGLSVSVYSTSSILMQASLAPSGSAEEPGPGLRIPRCEVVPMLDQPLPHLLKKPMGRGEGLELLCQVESLGPLLG
jgi:hypothetical protein